MIPNIKIKPNVSTNNSIIGSRAYTFLDSYVYMKNQKYNALYEKNKEILAIENNAINLKSANILYSAFTEQCKILDTLILRIRNYSLRIKPDIFENINLLRPSNSAMDEFDNIINNLNGTISRMKCVLYDIHPIEYENVSSFMNLYKMEIKRYTDVNNQTANKNIPLNKGKDKATKYLIEEAMQHANVATELLEMEHIRIINQSKLKSISSFFKHFPSIKSNITKDFKTFQFYLRKYSGLKTIVDGLKPNEDRNGKIWLKDARKAIEFTDYFVLYKHFSSMVKYIMKIIDYREQQFFNKIYALQSNIESYTTIINEVLDYKERTSEKSEDSLNESIQQTIKLHKVKHDKTNDAINDYYDILLNNDKIGKIATSYYEDIDSLGIGSFEIKEEFRGNGYGTLALKELIKSNKDKALIYCYVDANNAGAIKLYKRLGNVSTDTNSNNQYYVELHKKIKGHLNEAYNDGFINSDELDSHSLINGNYAANLLLNDDVERIEDDNEDINYSPDKIEDVTDEEIAISNFSEFEGDQPTDGIFI